MSELSWKMAIKYRSQKHESDLLWKHDVHALSRLFLKQDVHALSRLLEISKQASAVKHFLHVLDSHSFATR
jgi:hypothetical protein